MTLGSRWSPTRAADLLAEARADRGPDDCWPWPGNVHPDTGYGRIRIGGVLMSAHRWAYTTHVGPVPPDRILDHTCHNADATCPGNACEHRRCVNYERHIRPRTHRDNILAGRGLAAINAKRTACGVCGRPYDTVSRTKRDGIVRRCSRCTNASNRRSAARTGPPSC